MSTKFILCLLATSLISSQVYGQAPAPSASSSGSLRIPVNAAQQEAAVAALEEAEKILGQAGQVDEAGIYNATTVYAHGAAEETFGAANAGQASAVHAGVASAAAALLAAGGALTNNESVISQAREAITTATALTDAIVDADILSVSESEFADLTVLAQLAHDSTLVHYWQNATSGPQDNETFVSAVENAEGLYEVVEEQAEAGSSSSLAVLSAHAIAHNLLGAIYTYQANDDAVAQQNIDIALVLLKAVRHRQTGATCSATWETVDPLINKAYEDATTASTELSESSLTTAISSAEAILSAGTCSDVASALAPAAAVSSAGRK